MWAVWEAVGQANAWRVQKAWGGSMLANLRDFKEALWNGEKGEEWQEIRSDRRLAGGVPLN